jgi:23S rRNA pseudouridine2605 synthase
MKKENSRPRQASSSAPRRRPASNAGEDQGQRERESDPDKTPAGKRPAAPRRSTATSGRTSRRQERDFTQVQGKPASATKRMARKDKTDTALGRPAPFWAPFAKNKPETLPREEREAPPQRAQRTPRKQVPSRNAAPPEADKTFQREPMRLNKFIAHCGICARRQAAEYVKQGMVQVNDVIETNPGYVVKLTDVVKFKGERVKPEERKVYFLMNKPKGVITTASDENGRKTVLDIVGAKVRERIFPVGRLDRNTTGLLLLTNDGELAKKLSHPSHKVKKFYQVTLNQPLTKPDMERIARGLTLEDGLAEVDGIDYVDGVKTEIGIEIHSGKNRIIRRIFEHLGYEVIKLDRTYYAGLTKKDIGRGHFRPLTDREIIMLRHFT